MNAQAHLIKFKHVQISHEVEIFQCSVQIKTLLLKFEKCENSSWNTCLSD